MNLLIGGCSFSSTQMFNESKAWVPYSDMIVEDNPNWNIKNIARSSYGQTNISHSLINELIKTNYDFVIVQWSAVNRSFSINEIDFIERIKTGDATIKMLPNLHEYSSELKLHTVTDLTNVVSKEFYNNSLIEMLLLKNYLVLNKIRYKMFWGWEQINDEIYDNNKEIIDYLYDENFWRYGKHGGLNEYGLKVFGKSALFPTDFHPQTKVHKLFYENVVKNWL